MLLWIALYNVEAVYCAACGCIVFFNRESNESREWLSPNLGSVNNATTITILGLILASGPLIVGLPTIIRLICLIRGLRKFPAKSG